MEQVIKNTAENIASSLLKINAIKLSPQQPFTWASGIKSPIYCDNRILLSYPAIRKQIIESMVEQARSFAVFDVVGGVATAGIAYGALLAHELGMPFVYVRSQAKSHGRQNRIEGELKGGERVLVVEDLISTGGSSLQAVAAIRQQKCEVIGVLAIFSYGFEKAAQAFAAANCPFQTLTNYNILLQQAVQQNYIREDQLEHLAQWRKAPEQWQATD